ncbi:MAG: ABC transporter ATP-binding protein [Candidatus Zixiibacteriota bacterium]
MIKVENLTKSYDQIKAVDNISFEISAGESFGLLGSNGAGKTTTLNLLVGILHPDSGSIHINGVKDPTQAELRREIGSSPQSIALYDDLTADENIRFFGKLYNLTGTQLKERVNFCLEIVGLTSRRWDQVKTFSGGMKRRLNLACAIVHEPQVLLLDEPTVGVDPQSRNLIFENIESLKKEGRTIIYTTHYMEEAQRLCDRVAIIDHGRILALDTVERLITNYGGQSVIEAELAGAIPEGIDFPGQLTGSKLRIETDQPMEIITRLSATGVKFRKIHIEQADLENVFLNLTGRRLRD